MKLINSIKDLFKSRTEGINNLLTDEEVRSAASSYLKLNRWSVFLFILFIATAMVFYVSNVLAINTLMGEVSVLQDKKKRIMNKTNVIKGDVIQLQSAKRIIPIAENQLRMIKPASPPKKIK